MIEKLKPAIARIWSAENKVVGTGVLVQSQMILTCAHVIRDALNLDETPEAPPEDLIKVDFPFSEPYVFIEAKSMVWAPRAVDDCGDIAGLSMIKPPPFFSKPISLINIDVISSLSGHQCRTYGFPKDYEQGVWSFSNKVQDERPNGSVQITNAGISGHLIQKGFSGGPIWDEELEGVVGITTTVERNSDLKVAFMIPTTKILEKWSELKRRVVIKTDYESVSVPTIISSMTMNQVTDIMDETAFNEPSVPPIMKDFFREYLKFIKSEGIEKLSKYYGESQEDWRPHREPHFTIEQIICGMFNNYNAEYEEKNKFHILPEFISRPFFSDITEEYDSAKKRVLSTFSILVVDAVSLFHPIIYQNIAGSGLLMNNDVAAMVLSPMSNNTLAGNASIEQLICSQMNYAFDRYEKDCDMLFEIGTGDIRSVKRWMVNFLDKVSNQKTKINEKNKMKFKAEMQYEPKGIEKFWMGSK